MIVYDYALASMSNLEILHTATCKFHLTGSRFFGNATMASDWDFFCQYSEPIRLYLLANGFLTDDRPEYNDMNLIKILRKGDIHIQLVDDCDAKIRIQTIIASNLDFYIHLSKSQRKALWNMMFNAYGRRHLA